MKLGQWINIALIGDEHVDDVLDTIRRVKDQFNKGTLSVQDQGLDGGETFYRSQHEACRSTDLLWIRKQLLLLAVVICGREEYGNDPAARIRFNASLDVLLEALLIRLEEAASRWHGNHLFYVNYQGLNPGATAYISHQITQDLCEETVGPYATLDEARAAREELVNKSFEL